MERNGKSTNVRWFWGEDEQEESWRRGPTAADERIKMTADGIVADVEWRIQKAKDAIQDTRAAKILNYRLGF